MSTKNVSSAIINVRKICPQVFEFEQLMSVLFENLSYESQCTSSLWTKCRKCCVVMLRFPCLYNTWALNFVMKHQFECSANSGSNWRRTQVWQDQSASRKCAVHHTYYRGLTSTRFCIVRTEYEHTFRAHDLLCSNRAQQNANFTSLSL